MTSLLDRVVRRLTPTDDHGFDVDAAAKEHHKQLMGYNLSLEERRERARALSAGRPVSADPAG